MKINVNKPPTGAVEVKVCVKVSHLARAASCHPLRPVTMQPRQSAWHWRANRRAPGMPTDGRAVRTGCENGTPHCSRTHTLTHTHTHSVLSTVALCANNQAGFTPTLLYIVTHVAAIAPPLECKR